MERINRTSVVVRMCCSRMLLSRAYLYGQVHASLLRCADV